MASTAEPTWGDTPFHDGGEDESLTLPTDTLALLSSFYDERDQHAKAFEDLRLRAARSHTDTTDGPDAESESKREPEQLKELSIEDFTEDWQLSQFWYDDQTSLCLAQALLSAITPPVESSLDTPSSYLTPSCSTKVPIAPPAIAIISAPTAYVTLHNLLCTSDLPLHQQGLAIRLLEHDPRFTVLPNFIPYDYTKPLILPASLTHTFDAILVDPPFLSEECQTKTAMTVRKLLKPGGKVVVCTGLSVEDVVERLYRVDGVTRQGFEPRHRRGLANEFGCWANFEVKS